MLTMGYHGPQMVQNQFVDNPFCVVPARTVCLYDFEIAIATAELGASSWANSNESQRRAVARYILERRGDPESKLQLDWLALNVPSMNSYQIIATTEQERKQFGL